LSRDYACCSEGNTIMDTSLLSPTSSRIDRALRFLERDPLLNYSAAQALLYGGASVAGMAESGEALVGVAVAGRALGGEPPPVYLDAIGPIAFRRLLATLRRPPRRIVVGPRTWLESALKPAFGAVRLRHGVELFAGDASLPDRDVDLPVQSLTWDMIEVLRRQSAGWNLSALAEHVGRGGEVLGIVRDGVLIAHAACGLPVGALEEISHVYTAPLHRGQGLAQAVTLTAMRAITVRGRRPIYRSRTGNTASRRVAERCGLIHSTTIRELTVEPRGGEVHPLSPDARIGY
jgi:GNAT superfamily N-acetyltransferase